MLLVGLLAFILPLSILFWAFTLISSWFYSSGSETEICSPFRCFLAFVIPLLTMIWGYKKKSLSTSGALAGSVIGFILTISNYAFITSLLTFFVSSSKATKYKSKKKAKFEDDFKEGGQRNWVQVICNGGIAAEMATLYMIEQGLKETTTDFHRNLTGSWLAVAVMATIAGANGDTWASEFGTVLANKDPILITTLKKVPKGTNGGITLLGLIVSALGGTVVGLAYYLTLLLSLSRQELASSPPQWPIILVASFAGLFDSVLDSVLGATLQFSGLNKRSGRIVEHPGPNIQHISGNAILDNHSVNLLSSLVTALVVPFVAMSVWDRFY